MFKWLAGRLKNKKITTQLSSAEENIKKHLVSYAINVSLRESDAFEGMHEYISMFKDVGELPKRKYPLLYWWVKTDGKNGSPVLSINTPRVSRIMYELTCSEKLEIDKETLEKVISDAIEEFFSLSLSAFNKTMKTVAEVKR
ncbi:hypothetical protein BTJ39_23360 [Izhakiella australiensis]|uniref:Uncharacterized protein n=1 Tax=Izhakiella australiensis TaxID=1926881 RepID=A0A1S8Y775_9GAMM|nr:hypothetical protein [Izhakiella australiensis]OON34706.1 hypothetical protein BTJ39_23360 [Izhakiella australiensis]